MPWVSEHPYEVPNELEWQKDAACLGQDEIFDFEGKQLRTPTVRWQVQRAKRICFGCPVLQKCADWAAEFDWYGTVVAGQVYKNDSSIE